MSDRSLSLAIVGGGAMGAALLRGLLAQSWLDPDSIGLSEPDPTRRHQLADRLGIRPLAHNREAARAEVILLAVKPQVFPQVQAELGVNLDAQLLISIMAGITLGNLSAAFPGKAVVRTMPNTPALVGQGITAMSAGSDVSEVQLQWTERLFQSVGSVLRVPESQLDAVTALSGSGPGYVAVIAEAMIDGGVNIGLPRPIATQLALQTLLGTAALLQQEHLHPAQLKDQVTSPGGTTIAGIRVLENAGIRGTIIEAIQAAAERSRQLRQ